MKNGIIIAAVVLAGFILWRAIPDRRVAAPHERGSPSPSERTERIPADPLPSNPPEVAIGNSAGTGTEERQFLAVTVTDGVTREPVTGARIELSGDLPRRILRFPEIRPGLYALAGPPDMRGEVTLLVAATGYVCRRRTLGSPTATDQPSEAFAFELMPLSKLRVHVMRGEKPGLEDSPSRQPCAVSLKLPASGPLAMTLPAGSEEPIHLPFELRSETDEAGVAEFTGLPPGRGYAALATDTSDLRALLGKLDEIEIPAGQVVDVTIAIGRGARVLGRIVDGEGQPGAGFMVAYANHVESRDMPGGGGAGSGWAAEARCEALPDGSFSLDRLMAGKKRVRCERITGTRVEAFTLDLSLEADEVRDVGEVGPVPLARGGSALRGIVVDPAGSPVEGATVRFDVGSPHEIRADLVTGPAGTFEFAGVPASEVFISAEKSRDGRQWFLSTRPTLEPGRVLDIVLELQPPRELPPGGYLLFSCRLPDGTPADLRELRIRGYLRNEQGRFIRVAQGGLDDNTGTDPSIFSLGRPPPGVYDVIAIGDRYVGRRQGCVVTDGHSERYELELEPAIEVRGRVLDGETGEGVVGRVLRILERDTGATDAVRTAPDGTFTVHFFAPGEHGTLAISAPGYEAEERSISGADVDLGAIRLTRRSGGSGRRGAQ